jgi:hypothetical protein
MLLIFAIEPELSKPWACACPRSEAIKLPVSTVWYMSSFPLLLGYVLLDRIYSIIQTSDFEMCL